MSFCVLYRIYRIYRIYRRTPRIASLVQSVSNSHFSNPAGGFLTHISFAERVGEGERGESLGGGVLIVEIAKLLQNLIQPVLSWSMDKEELQPALASAELELNWLFSASRNSH